MRALLMGVIHLVLPGVYGLGGMGAELIRKRLLRYKILLLVRCLVYVLCAYVWEFSCGLLLDALGAN